MAKKILVGYDFTGLQHVNVRNENLASAPGSPFGGGHSYFDTTLNAWRYYDGTVFRTPVARGDHTGTQVAATISNFATTAQSYSLDLFTVPAANLNLNSKRITNLADPLSAQDAATQNYVLTQVQSTAAGISSKDPVRALSTANQATLSGVLTVDGVSLVAGDRVLLTGQTTQAQNGPWTIQAGGWTRPTTEGATQWELDKGALWLILEGTVYAGTQFRMTNTGVVTPGTTAITIAQYSAASTNTAGNGLLLTTGAFSIKLPGSSGLIVDGTGLYVDTTIVTKKFAVTIGDASTVAFVITHNLNTQDINLMVRLLATQAEVEVDWAATSVNTATVTFAVAPALNSYRVAVFG